MSLDYWLMTQINGQVLHHLWLDALSIFLAYYLPFILFFIFVLFLLINFKRYWWMFLEGVAASGASWLLAGAVGFLFYRARPFVDGGFVAILQHAPDPSFPSTHASVFFALSAIVCFYNKKAGIVFLIGAVLISAARVFCGVHWPSDVLAGMGLGVLLALLVHLVPCKILTTGGVK